MTEKPRPDTDLTVELEAALAAQESWWTRGQPAVTEELLRLHPALAAIPDAVLELVYNEAILRERYGTGADVPDLQRRFPTLADELAIQWQVDQALVSGRTDPSTRPHLPQSQHGSFVPTQIGRYRIDGVLGSGGMGVVYKAWDPALTRLLALKTLKGRGHSDETLSRFRTEATAIAQLHHPHVVQVFDVGDADGFPYFVMEYCAGGTLADRLKQGPLVPAEAAAVVAQVGQGVSAAHAGNVLHRDLKPSNVLRLGEPTSSPAPPRNSTAETASTNPASGATVDGPAVYKVSDFGLAKDLTGAGGLTESGAILGTPNYMPPEQAFGRSEEVGPTADVYSLGALLYECLTGRPPFQGATVADTLAQVREQEPVPVRLLQPSVPRDLETVCLKCLQKEPILRYQTSADVVAELDRFLTGRPVVARPVGRVERAWRWARRNRLAASLGMVVAVVVSAAAVGGTVVSILLNSALSEARQDRETARESERQTRAYLAASHAMAARLALQRGNGRAALKRLDEASAAGLDTTALRFERVKALCAIHELAPALAEIRALSARDDLGDLANEVELWQTDLELDSHGLDLDVGLRRLRLVLDRGLPVADQHYARGLMAGTVPEALDHFRRAVQTDPINPRTNTMLAMLLVLSGQFKEASERLLAAELLFPEHPMFAILHAMLDAFLARPDTVKQRLTLLRERLGEQSYTVAESTISFAQELIRFCGELEKLQCGDPGANYLVVGIEFQRAIWKVQAVVARSRRELYLPFPPGLLHAFQQLARDIPPGISPLAPGNKKAVAAVFERMADLQPDAFYLLFAGTQRATVGTVEELRKACELFRRAIECPSLLPVHRMSVFGAAVAESNLSHDLPVAERDEHRKRAIEYMKQFVKLDISAEQGHKISRHCERLNAPLELTWHLIAAWDRAAPQDPRLRLFRAKTHLRTGAYESAIRLANDALKQKEDPEWRDVKSQAEERWRRQSAEFFRGNQ